MRSCGAVCRASWDPCRSLRRRWSGWRSCWTPPSVAWCPSPGAAPAHSAVATRWWHKVRVLHLDQIKFFGPSYSRILYRLYHHILSASPHQRRSGYEDPENREMRWSVNIECIFQSAQDIKYFYQFIQFENICNLVMYFLESTWEGSNIPQVFKNSGRCIKV